MRALAHAKVNLSLRVGSVRNDGFHPLHSLFQSVSLSDRLELARSDVDGIHGWSGGAVPDGDRNLAWQAVEAVRGTIGASQRLTLRLDKQIPIAAGLGGGSADAAAALHLAQRFFSADPAVITDLAPDLGSDVPFCAVGGTAVVRGRGEIIEVVEPIVGYGLAVVVPPVELATPRVYAAWDDLGEPSGPEMSAKDVPPVLRSHGPLSNDLYPAAVAVAPVLDDWRAQLSEVWGRPVAMSGSGASLFAFFVDEEEAASALRVVPLGARATHAVSPIPVGWAFVDPAR